MATAKPVLIATRILDYDRTALAADNADYTVNKGSKPNLIYVVQVDEEKGAWAATYKLQWKNTTDAGAFADLAATGEINWVATTSLVQGTAVTARSCTATGGAGSTWQNGEEVEGASTSDSINLADEYYTEIHFAINCASAIEGKTYDFQVIESGGGTSINTFASSLIITSDQPSVVLNTAEAYEFSTDTPTLEFTGTDGSDSDIRYNIQIDTVNTFDSNPAFAYVSNIGSFISFGIIQGGTGSSGELNQAAGQTVNPPVSFALDSASFRIYKLGTPTDNLYVEIHTTSETGALLGTSASVDITTFLTGDVVNFAFASPISLNTGTIYYFVILRSGARDESNYAQISTSNVTATINGVKRTKSNNVWTSATGYDAYIILYGDGPLLDKVSGTDAGFANTVTPADTDPFNSGEKCDYDVQAGEELADDTYYWRVRGMDPSPGSGSYGSWAATQSFIVNTGGGGFNSKVMVDGAWKAVSSASVMVDGAWKAVNSMKVMVDGAWKAV